MDGSKDASGFLLIQSSSTLKVSKVGEGIIMMVDYNGVVCLLVPEDCIEPWSVDMHFKGVNQH